MIEEFYGFSAAPFTLSPDSRFFYDSRGHRKALSYLQFGLQQGEGFIVITGEIGAGKSTLINRLLDELDRSTTEVAYITTSNVNADDVLRLIAGQFHIDPPSNDKAALLRALEGYLTTQRRMNRRVLVIVDEAQNLPTATIEELRMLSNLSAGGQAAFQCFLVGQPQFKAILADPDMEQLRQRVIASYHLDTLGEVETERYIQHRMQVVGWNGRPSFTDDAFALIYKASGGVPRRINNLCSRLLMHGAIEELDIIDEVATRQIVSEMGDEVAESAIAPPKGGNAQSGYTDQMQPVSYPGQTGAQGLDPALSQMIYQTANQVQNLERMVSTLERNQTVLSRGLTTLQGLEARLRTMENNGGTSGATGELASLVHDCAARMQDLDRRLTDALADLPIQAGENDTSALEKRLDAAELAISAALANGHEAGSATNPALAQRVDDMAQNLRDQGDVLQELMQVTLTLLGHGSSPEPNEIEPLPN